LQMYFRSEISNFTSENTPRVRKGIYVTTIQILRTRPLEAYLYKMKYAEI